MPERIHLGHSLTRPQAARRAGIPAEQLALRPDLLRIRGRWLGEVYYAFQFGEHGIRPDLADVVRSLHDQFDDTTIADWMARPNERLDGRTPVGWSISGGDRARLMKAAHDAGPVTGDEAPTRPSTPTAGPAAMSPGRRTGVTRRRTRRRDTRRGVAPRARPTATS
jgi:hypothetical protein